jgi:hypothetical protein
MISLRARFPRPADTQRRRSSSALVAELTRRDGSTHREINAWINRKLGIRSVEHASLHELERSVELLMSQLTRR